MQTSVPSPATPDTPSPQATSVVPRGLALIFDLDGVIVDSMPLHTEAWRTYLSWHGIPPDDVVERMHGRRNDEIVALFFGASLTPDQIFQHGAAKEALFRKLMSPCLDAHLVPGLNRFLDRCPGTPLGLGSNAEPANVDFVLDGAGLRRRFDVIVDGHQVRHAKPAPDIYLKAAELLKVPPHDCIVFEDSPAGIEAARRAGSHVAAVQTFQGHLPSVDLIIRDFEDSALESWLRTVEPRA